MSGDTANPELEQLLLERRGLLPDATAGLPGQNTPPNGVTKNIRPPNGQLKFNLLGGRTPGGLF